jgi:hypothetical protein
MPGLSISTNIVLYLFSHLDDPVHHILTSPKQFCLLNSRVLQQLPPCLLYFPSDFTGVHLKTTHIFWYHYSIHMEELRKSQNTAKIASLQPQNQNWYIKCRSNYSIPACINFAMQITCESLRWSNIC